MRFIIGYHFSEIIGAQKKNLENILELRTLTYVNKLRKETNLPDS